MPNPQELFTPDALFFTRVSLVIVVSLMTVSAHLAIRAFNGLNEKLDRAKSELDESKKDYTHLLEECEHVEPKQLAELEGRLATAQALVDELRAYGVRAKKEREELQREAEGLRERNASLLKQNAKLNEFGSALEAVVKKWRGDS